MTLDRKTKDIDASVELLEDRIKLDKYVIGFFLFLGLFVFLLCAITDSLVDEIGLLILGLGFVILMYVTTTIFMCDKYKRDILIYLKKQFEEKK